jgi:polar amino acid transport system permease protein
MDKLEPYIPYMLRGISVTAEVTVLALLVFVPVAVILGLARGSHSGWLSRPSAVIVEFFRGTSALVQLFWAFYALPLIGIQLSPLLTGVLVLGLNEGSYGSEIVRAGINSVPAGQWDAAKAIGLPPVRRFWNIVLPQALTLMLPAIGNAVINMLKFSALVSLITLQDLTFRAGAIVSVIGQSTAVYSVTLIIYFVMALILAGIMYWIERRVRSRFGLPRPAPSPRNGSRALALYRRVGRV